MKTQAQTKKSKRNYIIVALIVVLLLLGVGYAAFSQTLTISGTATGSATWSVKFVEPSDGTIDSDGHTLTVKTEDLQYPGDAKEVTATIKNESSMDIELTDFTVTEPSNEDIELDYVNLEDSKDTEILSKNGGTCTYKFIVKWKDTSTSTTVNDSYTIKFDYKQHTTSPELESSHSNK